MPNLSKQRRFLTVRQLVFLPSLPLNSFSAQITYYVCVHIPTPILLLSGSVKAAKTEH